MRGGSFQMSTQAETQRFKERGLSGVALVGGLGVPVILLVLAGAIVLISAFLDPGLAPIGLQDVGTIVGP
jgi:hypothetical protein